jgi:hypothetical protein
LKYRSETAARSVATHSPVIIMSTASFVAP